MRFEGGRRASSLALVASIFWAGLAHAQAWLPSGGTGSVSVSYTDSLVKEHYLADGGTIDIGHIRFFNYDISGEYSPTDKWMVVGSLPIVESKYYGDFPHPTEVDDGSYHATATDLRTEVHYQWLLDPVAIAPYIAYVLPTHHYETLGHAAPGRGLHELWIGTGLGKSLDKWIPKTYVETRVTYSQVEKVWDPTHVWDISHNKWMIDGDIGHFITPDLSVSVIGHWQRTLGGISIPPPDQLFVIHDQAGMENFLELGVGGSWSYNDHSGFSFNFIKSIEGRNGHKLDRAVSVSYSYGFGQH